MLQYSVSAASGLAHRQPLDISQADDLTMLWRELLERAGELPAEHIGVLDRELFACCGAAACSARPHARAGVVDDRVPRDLVERRPYAAVRRVVGLACCEARVKTSCTIFSGLFPVPSYFKAKL